MSEKIIYADLNNSDTYEIITYPGGIEIPLLYEDNHILIAIKPPGILSQEDKTKSPDMLTIIKSYLKEKYNKPGNVFLGLLHRLDRPVGGVMVFAKTSKAASRISSQIRERTVEKKYYAVVKGIVSKKSGVLESRILKNSLNISEESEKGKLAVLEYNILSTDSERKLSLLEINLITGRSHQIRVQLKNEGYPIASDRKYGTNKNEKSDIALFSFYISFSHPTVDEKVTVKVIPPKTEYWKHFRFI